MLTPSIRSKLIPTILLTLFALSFIGCLENAQQKVVLFDFESDADLDRINWRCFRLYSISDRYASNGSRSLKLEIFPSPSPVWSPRIRTEDWRQYASLEMEFFNPQDNGIGIILRLDDREDIPPVSDRYNKSVQLRPGANVIQVPLQKLTTSGSRRTMDLDTITRFLIFMQDTERCCTLYLDYVRLVSYAAG